MKKGLIMDEFKIPDGFVRCAVHEIRNWFGYDVNQELIEKVVLADTSNRSFYEREFEDFDYDNLETARITYGLDTVPREYVAESLGLYLTGEVWPTYAAGQDKADVFFEKFDEALKNYMESV